MSIELNGFSVVIKITRAIIKQYISSYLQHTCTKTLITPDQRTDNLLQRQPLLYRRLLF